MLKNKRKIWNEYKAQLNNALNDIKTPGKRHKQIPNILTILRMSAPLAIIPSAICGNIPALIGLVTIFSLTDVADGFIARKFNLTSDLGKDLDAICDKIFALTLLLSAAINSPFLLFSVGLEGIISFINIYKKTSGEEPKSSFIGKLKTWALFGLVGAGLTSPYLKINKILKSLFIITTGMQALTIKSYLQENEKNEIQENTNSVVQKEETNVSEINLTKTKNLSIERNMVNKPSTKREVIMDKLIEMRQLLANYNNKCIENHNLYKKLKK